MPKVVAVVPMRHDSERVRGKNYRPLAGRPLYHHIVRTLLQVPRIDTVVIDTDSELILADAAEHFPMVELVRRPEHLRSGDTPMNDVLLNTVRHVDADVVVQTHSTNPFLSHGVLARAVDLYLDAADLHSVFGVSRLQARLWTADGTPMNHDPEVLLRTQDLPPVFVENSCMYVFAVDTLLTYGNRLGKVRRMVEVPALEAVDIDEESDFELAIALASRMGGDQHA